ncbi:MAG: AAA family ATPase [Micromonosporaceae bacterium]|nr:AAA family ATPase [Micromonosporaceae bacterium]
MGRYALLLGTVICHADRRLQPLPSVRQDVAQLKALLDGSGGFDEVKAVLDLPAAHMVQIVEEFYGARSADDLALFYYSGHGVQHDDDRESVFLAATDTATGQLHATALDTDGMLRHLLNITKASQKVVLLDCCFSGAFGARHRFRGGLRQEPRRGRRERGTFVLTSSTHLKASKAQGPDQPSVFTKVLLNGLRGGAATVAADDGWITTHDLSRYAITELARCDQNKPVESSEGVSEPIRLVLEPGSQAPGRPATGAAASPAADAPFDADQWRRVIAYYVNCMQRSAVLQSFIDPRRDRTYVAARAGGEAVLTATAPIQIGGRALALLQRAREDKKELRYGYPVVAVRQGRRRDVRLAPLLICDVTVGDDGVLHPCPPRPSPALVDHCQLAIVEADELVHQVEQTFVPGDRQALAATVDLLMKTFGLKPMVDLDPAALSGTVQPAPIDRVQNTAVLYIGGATDAPEQQLVEDLRFIAKNPRSVERTALSSLAACPPAGSGEPVVTVALNQVNEAQEAIIQAAMSRPLTVAQGPPGTGKSQLVTALLATATAAGQSVLVGSTSNQAVDSVADRVTEQVGPGLLVRTGNKERRDQEPKYIADILAAYPPTERQRPPDTRTPMDELRLLAAEAAELRRALDERRLVERDLADLAVERRQAPADAVRLPEDDLALQRLVSLTDRALGSRWFGWWYRWRLRQYGVATREAIAELAERAVFELRWRERGRHLATLPAAEVAWRRLTDLVATERPAHSVTLLHAQIARRVAAGERLLRERADEMAKPKPNTWACLPQLLTVLPGWATTAMSARRLCKDAATYDLVVIDEAAQCTVPQILPMLYRAKRALIIGDPRQLTPVVDLPADEDNAERVRADLSSTWLSTRKLTYTEHSAYDAFATAAGETFLLNEHYRCHPDIIEVPNREVYQGRLTVLTDPARLAAPADPAVRWRDVPGAFRRGTNGSGRNDIEITAVVDEVRQLRAAYPDASIGVVTPLAAHRRALATALRTANLDDNLLCETIHKFQGSERDIMVISPVGAQDIPEKTRDWLVHQTNLWNVAITRAKSQLVVVGDRSWWSSQRGLLTALADGREPDQARPDDQIGPADLLHRALRCRDITVRRDVTVAGHPVDLVASHAGIDVAVVVDDPDGDADGRALRTLLARLDIVHGNMPAHRAPAWQCLVEPERVAATLARSLHQLSTTGPAVAARPSAEGSTDSPALRRPGTDT